MGFLLINQSLNKARGKLRRSFEKASFSFTRGQVNDSSLIFNRDDNQSRAGGFVKWRFITVGKPSLGYAKSGVEEYLRRLRRYVSVEMVSVKSGSREEEGSRLLAASEGCYRLVFDERGELLNTRDLAGAVTDLEMDGGIKSVAVVIGGAEGHGNELRKSADRLISFGRLTLQHELALVASTEQIYRVYSLKRGEPYHR